MKATITSIKRLMTKDGYGYMLTFKLEDGKSARTWIMSSFRNYKRWKPIIEKGVGAEIEGLRMFRGSKNLVDADSMVKIDLTT